MNPAIPTQQPQQPQPNWWERALPTLGGIVGGVGGAAFSGGLGGVGGAMAGDALGKVAENYFDKNKDLNSGVTGSMVAGGAGQLAGEGTGAVIKGGAGLVSGALSGLADKQAASVADSALQKGLTGLTNDDIIKGGVGTGKQLISDMGITPTPENMAAIPQAVGNAFNDHINNVLKTTGTVDLTDAGRQIAQLDPATQNILTPNLAKGTDAFTNNADPAEARKLLTAVQSAEANAKPVIQNVGQKIDPVAQRQYQNLGKVVDTLKGAIYDRPGVDEAFATAKGGVTPGQLAVTSPSLTDDEATAAAKYANDTLDNAKNGQDVLTPYSKLISLGQAGQKAVEFNKEVLPIRQTATENPELIGKTGQTLATAHPIFNAGVKVLNAAYQHAPLEGLSNVIGKGASSKAIPLLARGGAIIGANAVAGNDAAAPTGAIPAATNAAANGTGNTGGNMTALEQYILNQKQLQAQLANQEEAGAGLTPNTAALTSGISTLGSSIGSAIPLEQKQQAAGSLLAANEQQFQNAGGAQGTLGGAMSMLGSLVPGSAANTYQSGLTGVATSIANALGLPASAIPQIEAELPSMMQNQHTATPGQIALKQIAGTLGTGNSVIPVLGQ